MFTFYKDKKKNDLLGRQEKKMNELIDKFKNNKEEYYTQRNSSEYGKHPA